MNQTDAIARLREACQWVAENLPRGAVESAALRAYLLAALADTGGFTAEGKTFGTPLDPEPNMAAFIEKWREHQRQMSALARYDDHAGVSAETTKTILDDMERVIGGTKWAMR